MFEIGFETMLSLKCLSFVPKICCKCSDNFWNRQIFRENLLNWKFGELKWDSNWELSTSCRTNVKLLVEYHPLLLPFLLPPKNFPSLCSFSQSYKFLIFLHLWKYFFCTFAIPNVPFVGTKWHIPSSVSHGTGTDRLVATEKMDATILEFRSRDL